MKNSPRIFGIIFSSLLITFLAGCNEETDKSYNYIGYSSSECSRIMFSCSQGEVPFSNTVGCGCKKSDTANDNEEQRSLDYLIGRFLKEKSVSPLNDGKIMAEYSMIGASEKGKMLTYDIYANIQEFFMRNDKIDYGSKKAGIIQFKIEQTNRNYIIREYTLFNQNNLRESDRNLLTADTLNWLKDKKAMDGLIYRIGIAVKQDGAIAFGKTMDAFIDASQPPSSQESAGQQSTQEKTQQLIIN